MNGLGRILLLMATLCLCACYHSRDSSKQDPIGVVRMNEDGILVVMLRAASDEGDVGDVQLIYKKSDPEYAEIISHVRGLTPGEEKFIPPWTK